MPVLTIEQNIKTQGRIINYGVYDITIKGFSMEFFDVIPETVYIQVTGM